MPEAPRGAHRGWLSSAFRAEPGHVQAGRAALPAKSQTGLGDVGSAGWGSEGSCTCGLLAGGRGGHWGQQLSLAFGSSVGFSEGNIWTGSVEGLWEAVQLGHGGHGSFLE